MKHRLPLSLLLLVGSGQTTPASDTYKANNVEALHLTGSWSGGSVPGPSDTAVWDRTVSSSNSTALGADLHWHGIRIADPGGAVTIGGSETLTLGSAGIRVGTQSLFLNVPTVFAADAPLDLLENDRGITFAKLADLGGHTLTVYSDRDTRFLASSGSGGVTNGALRFTGVKVLYHTASIGAFTLLGTGGSAIHIDDTSVSNSQLNLDLDDTSSVRLGPSFSDSNSNVSDLEIGNLTGSSGTMIIPDFNKTVGVRTLAVNQTNDGVFHGRLRDANNDRDLGLTKTGAGTLELTKSGNYFSGPTSIKGGKLKISGVGRLDYYPQPGDGLIGNHIGDVVIVNNAIFHFDSSATQELTGALAGSGRIMKSNTGFLTLSGDSSAFTGDLQVNGGRLILDGPIGGDVSIASNASLGGTGTSSGSLTTAPGSSLILAGAATVTALSVNGATIADPSYIEFAAPQVGGTVYDVLTYGPGGLSSYDHLVPLARGTLSHDTVNNKVIFDAEAPATRTWAGGDGVWDSLKVLQNWVEGDQIFFQGDQVIFDALAADTTITLDGLLAPASVSLQHTANTYTLAGGANGGLVGNGTFTQSGGGTVEIASASPNFAGSTSIGAGIFRFVAGGAWGSGPIQNEASLEIESNDDLTLINPIAGSGTLTKRGAGSLTLGGQGENSFTGDVSVEAGQLVLDKPAALGIGDLGVDDWGAKTVTVADGAQLDFNGYAPTGRNYHNPSVAYSFKIAGDGGGDGALINSGKILKDFAGVLNLELTGDATVGGLRGYDIGNYFLGGDTRPALEGEIKGNGHTLTKTGENEIFLRGPATDLRIVVDQGSLGIQGNPNAFGGPTGLVTVKTGATLGARGERNDRETIDFIIPTPIVLNDATTLRDFRGDNICKWTGSITLNGAVTMHTPDRDKIISGIISGSGGISKTGAQVLTLNANNTYTGPTAVEEGRLIVQQPYLADAAAVEVASGATLELGFAGTDRVGSLTLGEAQMPPGIYNASTHPELLAGSGALEVAAANGPGKNSGLAPSNSGPQMIAKQN